MAKPKYTRRLEKLFSEINAIEPKPASAPPPGSGEQPEGPLAPAEGSRLEGAPESGAEDADAPTFSYNPEMASWGEFLDGIRRRELLAYIYERTGLKEIIDPEKINQLSSEEGSSTTLQAPIEVSGEQIGKLLLEADPGREWTEEDIELVNAVAQQLSQQVETLRLLDEAQRSRSEAEHALVRLSRQGGRRQEAESPAGSKLPILRGWAENGTSLGLSYSAPEDRIEPIQPESPESAGHNPVEVSAQFRVGEELMGELKVSDEQPISSEDANLIETVAQRLSQQMENLRLLEESRHFRSETEDSIQRLTYQSWQAYLSTAGKTNLGFEYNRNRVQPLSAPLADQGDPQDKTFPLKVRDEVIGRLAVDSPVIQHEDTVSLINVIGERLGAHLDNLRLAEQREQALAETEMMYGVSARLSTAQSLEDALSSVSEPARDTDARDSRLFFITLDERGQPEGLTLAAIWYPEDGPQIVPVSAHFLLSDYPSYRQILSDPNRPMLISDVNTDTTLEPATRELFFQTSAQAAAVLPLAISGRWVGIIFINWEAPHMFTEQESRLYASLARQAAVVVNNRLLLEQTRKRAQELQTVAQVSTAASTVLDPMDLLRSVVDLTKSSFSLYHAQVLLCHERDDFLEIVAGSGEIGREIVESKILVPMNAPIPAAKAARERSATFINDTLTEPDYRANPLLPDVRSEMAIPMVVGDRLLGIFNVQADTPNRFTREDARIYATLASQVAVALQNAELYAEQTATVERLRELDHLKSAFLANMSHELRTPLNSILGFAEVLLLELDGPLNEIMNNDIRLIEKNGKHLLSLINDVLDMAKIEAGRMNLAYEKFILRELLEETMDITSSLAREKMLYLVIDPDSQDQTNLVADRVRIRQVLINVVANAVKFTEKGGITLCATQFPEEQRLLLEIRDTGMGIPKEKLETIFESFSQVDTSTTRKAGGTGLGLPISRKLVEMHGGRLWAESAGAVGQGSIFYVELPFDASKHPVA